MIELEELGDVLPGERDRFALVVVAEAEVAEHLEERAVASGAPTFSMSLFAPATRKQRCTVTARGAGAGDSPRKTGTNCSIPAIVKSVVDISSGIKLAEGRCLCPCETK